MGQHTTRIASGHLLIHSDLTPTYCRVHPNHIIRCSDNLLWEESKMSLYESLWCKTYCYKSVDKMTTQSKKPSKTGYG